MNNADTQICGIEPERKLVGITLRFALWVTIAVPCVIGPLGAVLQAQSYLTSTGAPSFAASYPAEMGAVDAASGNLHLEIPLGSFSQRAAGALVPKLLYDSHIWMPVPAGIASVWTTQGNHYNFAFGTWGFAEGGNSGVYNVASSGHGCNVDYVLWSDAGIQHFFNIPGTLNGSTCSGGAAYAVDSSGYQIRQTAWNNQGLNAIISVYAPDGTEVWGTDLYSQSIAAKDSNGNYLGLTSATAAPPGINNPVIDTLGRKIAAPATNSNPMTIQVPNSQGGTSNYVVTTTVISVNTNFHEPGVAECSNNNNCTITVISSVGLPDGTSYSFFYDCLSGSNAVCNSPSSQVYYYGTLTGMTLPSGEAITYGYSMFGGVSWGSAQNEYPSRWVTSKVSSKGTWTYTPQATAGAGPKNICLPGYQVGCMQTTVTKPDGSKEITSFIVDPYGGSWPQKILSYDTDGSTLLSTVNNTWDFSTVCSLNVCYGLGYQNVRKLSTATALPVPGGSITKQTTYTYDTPQTGNLTAIKQWRYQSGTTFPTVPDRAMYTTYATIGTNNNISRPLTKTVCNSVGTSDANCQGHGTTVARTTITYDAYGSNGSMALASVTGTANHDDTKFGVSYTTRGNATQISQWVGGSSYLTSVLSYDTTGQVIQTADPAGNATSYSYAPDDFYTDDGSDPPTAYTPPKPTNAYVVRVTDQIGSTSNGYYYGSGRPALSTDYDGQPTYSHYIDLFDRPTQTDYPIGWTLTQYHVPSGGETEIDSFAPVSDTGIASGSCTGCIHTQAMLDSLGRVTVQNLVNNPAGEVTLTSTYDGLNQVVSTNHPKLSSDPSNWVELGYYDGLGRSLGVTHPDFESRRALYGPAAASNGGLSAQQGSPATYGVGFPVAITDESGREKQEWLDGFGHIIEVDEPSATTATPGTGSVTLQGGPDTNGETGFVTVSVNGFTARVEYGVNFIDYASTIIGDIAGLLNAAKSPVVTSDFGSTLNNATLQITANASGAGTNYPLSATITCTSHCPTQFSISSSGSSLTGGTGGLTTAPNATFYKYDALGNLTEVVQGAQTRQYSYDGLRRLIQETTPEAGQVTISYVTSSGSLCSGNPSNPCSRTAPAPNQTGTTTVTTTYTYDTANRLKGKTHSDTTGTVAYTYRSAANGKGLLGTMTDSSGSETYQYDKMGRITNLTKKIGSTSYVTQYGYNSGGQLTSIIYPSSRTVAYNYDTVGHLCQVATATNGNCNATSAYLTLPSASYDAMGRPLLWVYGNTVQGVASYNPWRFEITQLAYSVGNTSLLDLLYSYGLQNLSCQYNDCQDSGQIMAISDVIPGSSGNQDTGRSIAYTYDQLRRLLTAKTTGSAQYPAWALSETYDRYGNRSAQTVTAGSGPNGTFNINPSNNRITGFGYDAAGDVISEAPPTETFTYDGEQCNTGYAGNGSSATYTCDGNGLRVKKVVTGSDAVNTVYIRSNGKVIAEYDNGAAVTSPTREYIFGNNLLAVVTGSNTGSGGTIVYQLRDHLSPRVYTDVNGKDVGEEGTYPFGEPWYSSSNPQGWIFTTYERDAESGNDYALARSYASTQGRFLAPDPFEGIVGDPQSWNRYAYVENDPINLSDASGQGFWQDLGMAIFDIFVGIFDPSALPAVLGFEGAGQSEQEIQEFTLCFPTCPAGPPSGGGNRGPGSGPSAGSPETTGNCPTGCSPGDIGGGPGAGTTDPGQSGASGQGVGSPGSWGAGGDPGATIGVNIWGRVGGAIGVAWMAAVVRPLNALGDWQDRHPLATLGVAVASVALGNGSGEAPLEEEAGATEEKLNTAADAIEGWLGKGYERLQNTTSDLALRSADKLRIVRFDLTNSHGLPPHINIQTFAYRSLYPGDLRMVETLNRHIFLP